LAAIALRATLREFYPAALVAFGEDLADRDAVAVLERAPTPKAGRSLTRAAAEAALRRAGRQRNVKRRAEEIREALRSEQLAPAEGAVSAYGAVVRSAMAVVAEMNRQLEAMEAELASHLDRHPDAEVIYSQPGLATVLGARVLGERGFHLTTVELVMVRSMPWSRGQLLGAANGGLKSAHYLGEHQKLLHSDGYPFRRDR
jgi:hypothetical protein